MPTDRLSLGRHGLRTTQKRDAYYGAFQGNFLKRIAALFPDRRRTLHLFVGRVDLNAFPGDTLDCNPALAPTYCCNAETCDGVPLSNYHFVLADPPYSDRDAIAMVAMTEGVAEQMADAFLQVMRARMGSQREPFEGM